MIMNYYEEYNQGHLVLPNALLKHFSALFPSAADFLVWLYFFENHDVAPSEIATKVGKSLADINSSIDRLAKFGAIKVTLIEIDDEMETFFDVSPVFRHLDELSNQKEETESHLEQEEGKLKELVSAFEAEMGIISPVQVEELRMWLFEDKYDLLLIKQALKEAVLNRKVSLNYIKAILRNWKNDGIRSIQEVENRQFEREETKKTPVQRDFYIPLEGPWNN